MNDPRILTLKITEDEYSYIRTLLKGLMDEGFKVNDLKWYDYEYILYALECARKEGEK